MNEQSNKNHIFYRAVTDKWGNTTKYAKVGAIVTSIIIFIFALILLCSSFTIIPTGYTGIKVRLGQVNDTPVQTGFHLKAPFVERIVKINNKQQDKLIEGQIWSETSERTAIYYENITVSYTINSSASVWIYANVDDDNYVSSSLVASAIKIASKQLTSTDATNRGMIEPLTQKELQNAINEKYGEDKITINKVVIANADFEDTYNQAIAAKQNAQLQYEQQQIENQKAIEKASADAEVKKTTAQAEADAKIIAANAEAEAELIKAEADAEANETIAASLTDVILKKMYYDTWNGQLPKVIENDSNLILNIEE